MTSHHKIINVKPAQAVIKDDMNMSTINNDENVHSLIKLQSFFYKHAPCIFFVTNAQTKIIDCNDHMIATLGYTKDELCLFNSCNDLLSYNSQQRIPNILRKYLTTSHVDNLELQVINKSGDSLDITVNATAVKNTLGTVIYHMIVWNVVTELIDARHIIAQQTTQLTKKCHELERRNSELNTFANLIVHDLKAPLRAINYHAELMKHDYNNKLSPSSCASFKLLNEKILRMSVLIDDIFAYFFNTQTSTTIEQIDWTNFIEDIKFTLNLPQGFTITSWNMPKLLNIQKLPFQQVIINILQNAIKYHHDPRYGSVIISGSEDQHYYYVYIGDNGPGIAQDYLQDIFRPLSRLRSCNNSDIEGSGLGLAIVDKIVQYHRGKIVVRSYEGIGTSFYFSWSKQ